MEREDLVRRLRATFLEELEERVRDFNRDFLTLEKDPGAGGPETLKSTLRTAHSLKGAARSVGEDLIESACHHVEDLLGSVRDGRRSLDRDLFQLLFAFADALSEAGRRLREGNRPDGGALTALLPRLRAVGSGTPLPAERGEGGRRPGEGKSAAQASPSPAPAREGATVRVAASKLDALLAESGELLVAQRRMQGGVRELESLQDALKRWRTEWRACEPGVRKAAPGLPRRAALTLLKTRDQLASLEKQVERLAGTSAAETRVLGLAAARLDAEVQRLRLFPFADACAGLERAARDLAAAAGKQVDLRITGGEVELDRSVLEGLKDPLLQLVRNAVAHGVEGPAERQAAGKPAQGRVRVDAALRGGRVEVEVSDDGKGLDLRAIRAEAAKRGLPEPKDERELARLVLLPGFSTVPAADTLSGRGLGLDVVRQGLEALHGAVEIDSKAGRGTRFLLRLPLTVSTASVLLVRAGSAVFAIPTAFVQKLARARREELRSVEGRAVLVAGGAPVPVVPLSRILPPPVDGRRAGEESAVTENRPLVILGSGHRRAALEVDELLAESEVVVKSLGRRMGPVRHVSGATFLTDGRVALILNAPQVLESALGEVASTPGTLYPAPPPASGRREAKRRVLIADDSLTTRSLLKSILEAAGFEAAAAADGAQAWQLLQEKGADLVVSDVDMPGFDGIALTEAIRGSKRFRDLPVVLVTALESEQDRARGVSAGADAYLTKSAFDQRKLLETIGELL